MKKGEKKREKERKKERKKERRMTKNTKKEKKKTTKNNNFDLKLLNDGTKKDEEDGVRALFARASFSSGTFFGVAATVSSAVRDHPV